MSHREVREEGNEEPALQMVSYKGWGVPQREVPGRGNKDAVLWEVLSRAALVDCLEDIPTTTPPIQRWTFMSFDLESELGSVLALTNGQ